MRGVCEAPDTVRLALSPLGAEICRHLDVCWGVLGLGCVRGVCYKRMGRAGIVRVWVCVGCVVTVENIRFLWETCCE